MIKWNAMWDGKGKLFTKNLGFRLSKNWIALLPPISFIGEIKNSENNIYFKVFDFNSKYKSLVPFKQRKKLLKEFINKICFRVPNCPIKIE